MKLVVVDDEPLARERIKMMVQELPGWDVVGEAGDGETALEVIRTEQPDAVLLDIRMAGMDGIQVARTLLEESLPPAIIFTTAYSEHAMSALDASATAYLLKPIRKEKLADALQRARQPRRAQVEVYEQLSKAQPGRSFIKASMRDGEVRIPIQDVIFFMADQKYTTVQHMGGKVLIEESLSSLEADLGDSFMRVHRKALVQLRFIQKLERDADSHYCLRMRHSDELLPIGRRRLPELRRMLNEED